MPGQFSFSGWNSYSLSPKAVTTPPAAATPAAATNTSLVGQVGAGQAANVAGLPSWLADTVSGLNSGSSLLTALQGLGGGGPAQVQDIGSILRGIAATTHSQAAYNSQVNQMNEASRLAQLVQQRNQVESPVNSLSNPFDTARRVGLDRQISDFQRVNIPAATAATSGWVSPMGGSARYSNGLLNGTGYI
jgi:hypothetical protein